MGIPEPISLYIDKDTKPLRFVQFDVGEGLMILFIFPNSKSMLFDCNLTEENKDKIIDELSRWLPFWKKRSTNERYQKIDIFVNSHRDEDHYRGLKYINKYFPIQSIIDSGQSGDSPSSKQYKYYMNLRLTLMEKHGDKAVLVPNPSTRPLLQEGGTNVFCLNAGPSYKDDAMPYKWNEFQTLIKEHKLEEARIQHTNGIVLSVEYAGRRLLLTGDSDYLAWRERIIPAFGKSTMLKSEILFASHHGSRSFFTDETLNKDIDPKTNPGTTYLKSLTYIEPAITLISCGKYSSAHHPNSQAFAHYKKHTTFEQVYTTSARGNICGYIDEHSRWTVVPTRFKNHTSTKFDISINCKSTNNGNTVNRESGDMMQIGESLNFYILGKGGIFDPIKSVSVKFEVSNGGRFRDHTHQEIYYKANDDKSAINKFNREVAYKGRHLLRCRVYNKSKRVSITRIFVVNVN